MPLVVQSPSRRPVGPGFVLLVLAVLAGVLAMHGLSPGPASVKAPATKAAAAGGGHGVVTVHEQTGHQTVGDCSHPVGGSGHAHHADATCAAAGVGAPYAPPTPTSALGITPTVAVPPAGPAGVPEGGREPPDLAELQLLRI